METPTPVTLEGTHVRLEPLSHAHLDGIMRAGEDDAIWQWLPYRPRTREEYAAWLEHALAEQLPGERRRSRRSIARVGRSSAARGCSS